MRKQYASFCFSADYFDEYDQLYNEIMEKRHALHKIDRIPCSTNANIQSEIDFYSNRGDMDSGMEINGNMRHAHFESVNCPHIKSLNQQLEQGSLSRNLKKRTQKSKTSKQSSKDQQQLIEKIRVSEKPQVQKLIKIREMIKLFHDKATLNSPLRQPVSYNPFQNIFSSQNIWFLQKFKLNFNRKFIDLIYFSKVIFFVLYFFIFPLSLLYQNLSTSKFIFGLKCIGIFLSFFDLTQTLQKNYTVDNNALNQEKYIQFRRDKKMYLILEFLMLLSTILSLVLSYLSLGFSNILFIGPCFNISHFIEQLHKLQDKYLNASQILKYWSLFKVIIKNLFVCHLLACTLIAIAFMNLDNNWMTPNNIDQLCWFQQYIWSYYFGTTIILTIGFGDLHANNTTEAFFIIVISFFACVFFGYNINYIGNLINNIKQEQNQRNTKLKLLNSLAKKSKVSKGIYDQISKYIIEQSKIKQKSNYTEEKKLLKELPQSLRSSFLQEANQKIFNHLRLLIPLGNQAIQKLSLKIQARFCHPDQMIKGPQTQPSLIILQSGEVGYITRSKYPSKLRNIIIERISSKLQQQSKLVCLDLLNQPLNYDIKSLEYSVIYEMDKVSFEETLIDSRKDYYLYRQLLDKCRFKLNQFALIKCRFCENRMHTLFQCPRIHYQPFRKTLPLKYNKSKKINFKQSRVKFERNKMQVSCQVIVQSKNSRQLQSELSDSKSIIPEIIEQGHHPVRQKRSSSNKLNRMRNSCFRPSNQNMMMTMQMVTQLRDDIKNLKRTSFTNFQFTLWENVDCDEACNFQSYFNKFNPDALGQKQIKNTLMSRTNRIKRKPKMPSNV